MYLLTGLQIFGTRSGLEITITTWQSVYVIALYKFAENQSDGKIGEKGKKVQTWGKEGNIAARAQSTLYMNQEI